MKELFEKLCERLGCKDPYISKDPYWRFYGAISGFYEDLYYSINIADFGGLDRVLIEFTTDNQQMIAEIVRELDKDIEIVIGERYADSN